MRRPILSVIIILIDKSDLFVAVRFRSENDGPRVSARTKAEGADLLNNPLKQIQKNSLTDHLE